MKKFTKPLALLLALVMIVGLLPLTAFAAEGFKTVTVTGIPNTGHWDPENQNDYLNIPEVYLSGSSTLTFTAVNGINISGIKIGDISVGFVDCKAAITFPSNADPTRFENDYHIAWMDHGGFTINLSQITSFAGLSEGAYTVSVHYGTNNSGNGTANLTVKSSVGTEEKTIAYSDLTGGSTGGGNEENGTVIPVPNVQMDTQYIAQFPDGAKWFFDADGETKSFGTLDADTYRNDLPVNAKDGKVQNDITLQSSTDGGIFNLPNNTKGNNGVFSIDWESGNYDHQKNVVPVGWQEESKDQNTVYESQEAVPSKHKIYADGYTDGSYTIVGWGGDFAANSDKNWLEIKLKDNGDGTLQDALSHLTIYTVGPYGAVYDKIYLGNTEFGGDTDNLKLVSGPDSNGYYTYEAHLRGSKNAQGIKFAFDRTSDSSSRHSGTLLIERVRVNMYGDKNDAGFANQWQDFGPFAYGTNKDSYEEDPTDSAYLPFIRSVINNKGTGENQASGANREKGTGWLLWTMSTSDANIVNNDTANTDALQIKYRHDTGEILAPHTTFTELDGTKDLNANWLVMTLGSAKYDEAVMDMNVQLIDRNGGKQMIRLGDFVKSMDSGADKIDAEYINGTYRTVYYDLTQLQGFNGFRHIRFYFDDVTDNIGSGSRDARFLYLTQVYLIGENATVYKEVDKTQAQAGEDLIYTISVWNNGTVNLSSYVVNDVLPSGVEFKSITCNGSEFTNYTLNGSTLTLNGTGFTVGKYDTYQVTVTVKTGTSNGTVLENSAVITKLGDKTVNIVSNTVSTIVASNEYVFYAEVGQKTTLPIQLGQSFETVQQEQEVSQDYVITVPNSKTATINGVNIPAGAEVRLSGPTDGGFKMATSDSIKIGDKGYALVRSNNTLSGFTSNKDLFYLDDSNGHNGTDKNGPLSSFVDGSYITLLDAPTGDNLSVTINLGQMWADTKTFTLSVVTKQKVDVQGDPKPNSFVRIEQQPTKATIEDVTEMVGKNSLSLLYTSTEKGIDTFTVAYNPGGTAGTTKEAKVTVYNYQVNDHVYVLDYGLPVVLAGEGSTNGSGLLDDATLKLDEDNTGYAFSGLNANERNGDGVADSVDYSTPYGSMSLTKNNGTATWNGNPVKETLNVTFTPESFMSDVDTFYYGIQVSKNGTVASDATNATPVMEGEIKVMPANVVYYEDNFDAVDYQGETKTTEGDDRTQSNDQSEQYGHDDAYELDVTDSAGSSTMLTAVKGEDGKYITKATFSFKGTGFDIVGRSTSESTGLTYIITKKNSNSVVKMGAVDTLYASGDLFQTPVIRVRDLGYDEYTVTLTVIFSGENPDNGKVARKVFYLDGIRIYDPLGPDGNDAYNSDGKAEKNAVIENVHNMVVGNGQITESGLLTDDGLEVTGYDPVPGSKAAVLAYDTETVKLNAIPVTATEVIDGVADNTCSLVRYLQAGPDNEIYLPTGSAFAFVVEETGDSTDRTLQIEAKAVSYLNDAPDPSDSTIVLNALTDSGEVSLIGTNEDDESNYLTTSTAMYYKIDLDTQAIKLTNGKYLVVVLGCDDLTYAVSVSNVKYNGYTVSNPLTDSATETLIKRAPQSKTNFVSLSCTTAQPRKGANVNFDLEVSAELAQKIADKEATFVVTVNEGAVTVKATASKKEANHYTLTFKAPKAVGTFPVTVQYKENGAVSKDCITSSLTIKK